MTDEDKIRNAYFDSPIMFFDNGPIRIQVPYPDWRGPPEIIAAALWKQETVEFRHEYGTLNGRRASRIIGTLGDTEIIVNEAYENDP